MKLVFLYGPPGVGKLTVGKELSAMTGYPLFHNHLVFDLVAALFEPFTPSFIRVCDDLRIKTLDKYIGGSLKVVRHLHYALVKAFDEMISL